MPLLTEREFQASPPEVLEVLAVAGRILDAEDIFVAPNGDVTCFFALKSFHSGARPNNVEVKRNGGRLENRERTGLRVS